MILGKLVRCISYTFFFLGCNLFPRTPLTHTCSTLIHKIKALPKYFIIDGTPLNIYLIWFHFIFYLVLCCSEFHSLCR